MLMPFTLQFISKEAFLMKKLQLWTKLVHMKY